MLALADSRASDDDLVGENLSEAVHLGTEHLGRASRQVWGKKKRGVLYSGGHVVIPMRA